jgi:hypothetical protein
VSSTDGDASSRLESAIANLVAGASTSPTHQAAAVDTPAPAAPVNGGRHVDDRSDDPVAAPETPDTPDSSDLDGPYTLPEIVPATTHVPMDTMAPPAPVVPPAPVPTLAPRTAPTPTAAATSASPPRTPARAAAAPPASGWGDHMTPIAASAPGAALRAPGRRPRVRRVTRVLRHIDPWSTFKVALLFSAVGYVVTLTAGVLLWRVADSTGTLANVERWFTQFGWETFELKGGEIFHDAWIIGLFGAVALTGGLVLLATLFNLVSDIVGGVRMTVLEEEVVERTVSSTRRYVVRRAPNAAAGNVEDWDVEDEPAPAAPRPTASAMPTEPPVADDWSVDDDDDDDREAAS